MGSQEEYEAAKRARYKAELRPTIEREIRAEFENQLPQLAERVVAAFERIADALANKRVTP